MDYIKLNTICPVKNCEYHASWYIIPSVKDKEVMCCPKCGLRTMISDKSLIQLRNVSRRADTSDDTEYDMVNMVKIGIPDIDKMANQYVLAYGWAYTFALNYVEQTMNRNAYYQVDLLKHIPKITDAVNENTESFILKHGFTPFNCGNGKYTRG